MASIDTLQSKKPCTKSEMHQRPSLPLQKQTALQVGPSRAGVKLCPDPKLSSRTERSFRNVSFPTRMGGEARLYGVCFRAKLRDGWSPAERASSGLAASLSVPQAIWHPWDCHHPLCTEGLNSLLKICAAPCRLNFAYRTHLQHNAIVVNK